MRRRNNPLSQRSAPKGRGGGEGEGDERNAEEVEKRWRDVEEVCSYISQNCLNCRVVFGVAASRRAAELLALLGIEEENVVP